MSIGVCGTNAFKLNAGREGYFRVFGSRLEVFGIENTPSDINEQPIDDESQLSMMNRLNHAIDQVKDGRLPEVEYVLAFENGGRLSYVPYVDSLVTDEAWVGVWRVHDCALAIAISAGVVFPNLYVANTEILGFDQHTVGSVMAKELGLNSKNPHLGLCGVDRQELLTQAAAIAFGSLLYGYNTIPYRI
jgi:non-canonical (house-cleaning) NTP pyrophosphatase